jgi:LmbE family N-acetylglucosaminyl deacetylase
VKDTSARRQVSDYAFVRVHRLVVLSPHIDDACLSVGALLHALSRRGTHVRVVTVFANDPGSTDAAGPWDRVCGFASAAAAARARRAEDSRACRILGAAPIWLPYGDHTYGDPPAADALWADLSPLLAGADLVLAPGFPLGHPDHRRLNELCLEHGEAFPGRLGFYAEQPYAAGAARAAPSNGNGASHSLGEAIAFLRSLGDQIPEITSGSSDVRWERVRTCARDRAAKVRAIASYRSQLRALGAFPLVGAQVEELVRRGELVGL